MVQEFINVMEFEVINTDAESSHMRVNISDRHLNRFGYVHGGIYFSLADTAAGALLVSNGDTWVTLNASINYLKGAQQGMLNAYAHLVKRTRNTAVIHVDIKNDDDLLLVTGTFTMYHVH